MISCTSVIFDTLSLDVELDQCIGKAATMFSSLGVPNPWSMAWCQSMGFTGLGHGDSPDI